MAFMMPITKKNYNIYGSDGNSGNKVLVRKTSQGNGSGGGSMSSFASNVGGARRKVRSEGPSLSTSPKHSIPGGDVIINRIPIPRNNSATAGHPPVSMARSVPLRGRGSAPIIGSPFLRQK